MAIRRWSSKTLYNSMRYYINRQTYINNGSLRWERFPTRYHLVVTRDTGYAALSKIQTIIRPYALRKGLFDLYRVPEDLELMLFYVAAGIPHKLKS